jgi:hypothetical protein
MKLSRSVEGRKLDLTNAHAIAQRDEPSHRWQMAFIAGWSLLMIAVHLALRFGFHAQASIAQIPLLASLILGGMCCLGKRAQGRKSRKCRRPRR